MKLHSLLVVICPRCGGRISTLETRQIMSAAHIIIKLGPMYQYGPYSRTLGTWALIGPYEWLAEIKRTEGIASPHSLHRPGM